MVEFRIKVNKEQRTGYFPKQVLEALGCQLALRTDGCAAVLYSQEMSDEDVLSSLRIIAEDIKLHKQFQELGNQKKAVRNSLRAHE